jgi:RND family efflux transporter MFP subunit
MRLNILISIGLVMTTLAGMGKHSLASVRCSSSSTSEAVVGNSLINAAPCTAKPPQQATSYAPSSRANGSEPRPKKKTAGNNQNNPALRLESVHATLQSREHAVFNAEVDGCIVALSARDGQQVKAGEVLLRQECSASEAELDSAIQLHHHAEETLAAHEWLLLMGAGSHLEALMARVAHDTAQANVQIVEHAVRKCSVKSSFEGRVLNVAVREQQCIRVGQPLFEVMDDSRLEVVFQLPVSQLKHARLDSVASVRIKHTGQTYPVRIIRHGARVDPLTQSLRVIAAIDGSFPALMAGMDGSLQLSGSAQTPAVRSVRQQRER